MEFKRSVVFNEANYRSLLLRYLKEHPEHRGDLSEAELSELLNDMLRQIFEDEAEKASTSARQQKRATAIITREQQPKRVIRPGHIGFPKRFEGIPEARTHTSYALKEWYFKCPYCDTVFTAPDIKDRALLPIDDADNPYELSIFTKSYEKDFLEYSLIEILVCPGCLYASDRGGFHMLKLGNYHMGFDRITGSDDDIWNKVKERVLRKHRNKIADTIDQRLEIAHEADDEGLSIFRLETGNPAMPRSVHNANVAIELAIDSIETLLEFYSDEQEAKLRSRQGVLHLMRARFYAQESTKGDREARKRELEEKYTALRLFMRTNSDSLRQLKDDLQNACRRFFLSDELLLSLPNLDKQTRKQLKTWRRNAMSRIRVTYSNQRRKHGPDEGVARRYYLKIENRSYEVIEEERAEKRAAQKAAEETEAEKNG